MITNKHVFGNGNMHFWQCQDTGTMNRSPTPDGVFRTLFRGGRGELGSVRTPFRGC